MALMAVSCWGAEAGGAPPGRAARKRRARGIADAALAWAAACLAGVLPTRSLAVAASAAVTRAAVAVARRPKRRGETRRAEACMDDAAAGALVLVVASAALRGAAPGTHAVVEQLAAMLPMAAHYQATRRRVASAKTNDEAEAAWRKCHRRAARRIGSLMSDIPAVAEHAPFARLLRWSRRVRVHVGVDGGISVTLLHGDGTPPTTTTPPSPPPPPQALPPVHASAPAPYLENGSPPAKSMHSDERPVAPLPLPLVLPLAASTFACAPASLTAAKPPPPPSATALCVRAVELAFVFAPLVLVVLPTAAVALRALRAYDAVDHARAAVMRARVRALVWSVVAASCAACGAAFIKLCQWLSARKDVLPMDANAAFARLQDDAPVHGISHTRRCLLALVDSLPDAVHAAAVADAGVDASDRAGVFRHIFPYFEDEPLASGSVAQVHRAQMRASFYHPAGDGGGARPSAPFVPVVLKVRHPRVRERIEGDFALLLRVASVLVYAFPASTFLRSLEQALAQFAERLSAQADLRHEAGNLMRFNANFREWRGTVAAPRALLGFTHCEEVLPETFEAGESVGRWIADMEQRSPAGAHSEERHPLGPSVVGRGSDCYLKMLLEDRFVHGDLHPGNILCRTHGAAARVEIVLLDFGLCEELNGMTRHHFLSFLSHMASGDGTAAARHLLALSNKAGDAAPDADARAFAAGVEALFAEHCGTSRHAVDVDVVLRRVLWLCRHHGVSVNAQCASLVVSVSVLVGMAKALDPAVNLLDAVAPSLLALRLTGRSLGRLYDGM